MMLRRIKKDERMRMVEMEGSWYARAAVVLIADKLHVLYTVRLNFVIRLVDVMRAIHFLLL